MVGDRKSYFEGVRFRKFYHCLDDILDESGLTRKDLERDGVILGRYEITLLRKCAKPSMPFVRRFFRYFKGRVQPREIAKLCIAALGDDIYKKEEICLLSLPKVDNLNNFKGFLEGLPKDYF